MCTRVMWAPPGHPVVSGRNMDWLQDLGTHLWVMRRGAERIGMGPDDANPARWTATYGSVVATGYDFCTTDGINEAGLAAHVLWLAEAEYGDLDIAAPGLSVGLWAQYYLDRFATVAEAVEAIRTETLAIVPTADPHSGRAATVHLALGDATGDSAIVEYLDGQVTVHHGPTYAVMTNSPPYDQQLELVKAYAGFGGDLPLPGTTEASDRFVRASYYLQRLPEPRTDREHYAGVLSVMRNVAQPFGEPDPVRPNISSTIWRTLVDHTNRVYAFESSYSPDIVWVSLDRIDFSHYARLDLTADDLTGNVTERFERRDGMYAPLFSPARTLD